MRIWIRNTAIAVGMTLFSTGALADQNLWLGLKAGTLGLGVEGSWRPIPWLDVRLGAHQFDYDDSGSQAGINYDATLSLDNFYGTANFRFPMSPMRLSIGGYSNGNELVMTNDDIGPIEIGGTIYPGAAVGTLTGVTNFDDLSPYVGVGFDFNLFDKVGMSLDLGVLWQGDPIVELSADGPLATDPLFQNALELERQALEDEFEDYKAWPNISLGFNYQFM